MNEPVYLHQYINIQCTVKWMSHVYDSPKKERWQFNRCKLYVVNAYLPISISLQLQKPSSKDTWPCSALYGAACDVEKYET